MSELTFVSRTNPGRSTHVLPTDKFKTTTVLLHIALPLAEETVTEGALLPNVLARGTANYPDPARLQRHLDALYGAVFSAGVMKRGERQIIQLYLEVANEKFLHEGEPLLEQGIAFLGDVLLRPLVENGAFSEKFVALEKDALAKRIEGLIDDKMRYANQRLIEEMCGDEPYRLLTYGRKEEIGAITPQSLYTFYQDVLTSYPIDLYVVGDVNPDDVQKMLDRHLQMPTYTGHDLPPIVRKEAPDEARAVKEEMNVSQGKLNIGLRTGITYADSDYVTLMMYNGVLGGFPHSKLFMNVREKASLAYYAVSQLESQKGLCMIMSGIETANYEKALSIIKEQLVMMEQGEISDLELNQTKAMLINQMRETEDSASAIASVDYSGRIAGKRRPLEETLKAIQAVTKEDIARVARQVRMDTIYFLSGKGEA